MPSIVEWEERMDSPAFRAVFDRLYGSEVSSQEQQIDRYRRLLSRFGGRFGAAEVQLISVPGRTEIGGNHTDHNHGRVLAAAIHLDAIAAVAAADDHQVVLDSIGYAEDIRVNLDDLHLRPSERGTTAALVRGIAARFQALGHQIGGFRACLHSHVGIGSGLSSSAAIEVLIAAIFNILYNQSRIAAEELAKIGQFAENNYFGKPCGLMDQMTCAVGGVVAIDFRNPQQPEITRVEADLAAAGFSLVVVDSGGHHADLTEDYAAIPREMRTVAEALGGKNLRDIEPAHFDAHLAGLRSRVGDRTLLRALHFFGDNQRVLDQIIALREGRLDDFIRMVGESGLSSGRWLQNSFSPSEPREQGINLALALTEEFIRKNGCRGGCRVHGGGFAGTILAILPSALLPVYAKEMQALFGDKCLTVLRIRPVGVFVWP